METNFHGLPPFKRYKLIQQQETNNPLKSSPLCLPAKKRKEISPCSFPDATTFCLPAKKRIWAPHPFNLNLEYKQENDGEETEDAIAETEEGSTANDDDGIVCAVCESTDGDPTDPIVLCDGCDLMVHATCYGHPFTKGIPQDDWYCDKCLASNKINQMAEFSCCLCPVPGGALKPTVDGKWAHLVCAIYVPEVFFHDPEGRRGIDCSKVLKRRWKQKCYVCEVKNSGCVIDCSEPICSLGFHVTCGLKEGLCIEYRQGKRNKGDVVAAFCSTHTDLWKKQEQTGKFKIVARDEHKK